MKPNPNVIYSHLFNFSVRVQSANPLLSKRAKFTSKCNAACNFIQYYNLTLKY